MGEVAGNLLFKCVWTRSWHEYQSNIFISKTRKSL